MLQVGATRIKEEEEEEFGICPLQVMAKTG
jgi:hypothetical protein